jgi:hypothetical protein
MKDIKKQPLNKVLPELKQIADYHGLRLNRAKEFKTTLFIFKNLYYNAPWETDETYDEPDDKKLYTSKGLHFATRNSINHKQSFLQVIKGGLRRLFKKFKS